MFRLDVSAIERLGTEVRIHCIRCDAPVQVGAEPETCLHHSLQLRNSDKLEYIDYRAVAQHHRDSSAARLREALKKEHEVESDTFLAAALTLLMNDVGFVTSKVAVA